MKYVELRKEIQINWNLELKLKINKSDRGRSSNYLAELAKDWITCATGNQCAIIPRSAIGRPEDVELEDLGMMFYQTVRNEEWKEAEKILHEIEGRSLYLIRNVFTYQPMIIAPLL